MAVGWRKWWSKAEAEPNQYWSIQTL